MIELRKYQFKLFSDICDELSKYRRVLAVLPTGGGKTLIFAKLTQIMDQLKKNVLILVHRRELLFQTRDKLKKFEVGHTQMLSGNLYDQSYSIVVASIPTMHSWVVRRKKEPIPPADLVIIDECAHLQSSKTWQDIAALYPNAKILGFTATPISKSGKGLGGHFDALVKGPTIAELTEAGWLVPVKYYCPTLPDLQAVKIRNGDYAEDQLEAAMDKQKLIGDICENWARVAKDRKTLVFAVGIKHSIHIRDEFIKLGVKAEHVDGNTEAEERAAIIKRFTDGGTQVMTSCGVFLEGFDAPIASALVFARPTKSLMLYLQAAGRGLRSYPSKENLIFLDHSGVVYEHGMLDQDFDWKLVYLKGDTEHYVQKKQERKRTTITCEKCKCVYQKRLDCPECGWKPAMKGKEVSTYAAYLQALDELENPKVDEKSWYLQLKGYAEWYGKKSGWAYYKFISRFGHKPPWAWKDLQSLPCGIEVYAWVRKENIRYAKSKRPQPLKTGGNTQMDIIKQMKLQVAASHGLDRKEKLAGDAYVIEAD